MSLQGIVGLVSLCMDGINGMGAQKAGALRQTPSHSQMVKGPKVKVLVQFTVTGLTAKSGSGGIPE